MKNDCIFCQIIAGNMETRMIYENDFVIAFLDIDPIAEGHTLVVPKQHCSDLLELDDKYGAEIIKASKMIAVKIFDVLQPDGLNVIQNNKKAAGQVVMHYHMHLVPRWNDDGNKVFNIQPNIEKDLFAMLPQTQTKLKM